MTNTTETAAGPTTSFAYVAEQLRFHGVSYKLANGNGLFASVRLPTIAGSEGLASNNLDDAQIIFTDLRRAWVERFDGGTDDVVERIKELNPRLGADNASLLAHVAQIVRDSKESEVTMECTDDNLSIEFTSQMGRVPFVWKFRGRLMTADEMFESVTQPWFLLGINTHRREEDLITIIQKKDEEIEAYKMSGASVARKSILTTKFDKEQWTKEKNCPKALAKLSREHGGAHLAASVAENETVLEQTSLISAAIQFSSNGDDLLDKSGSKTPSPTKSPAKTDGSVSAVGGNLQNDVENMRRKEELKRMKVQEEKERLAKKLKRGPRF